jgi:hypothetical protein
MDFKKLLNWVAGFVVFAAFFALAAVGATTVERFTHPIVVNANATTDANLGTISSVANGSYYDGSFTAAFTGPCNLNVATKYVKTGKLVCLTFANTVCTASTGSSFVAPLPSGLQPASATVADLPLPVEDSGSVLSNPPGLLEVQSLNIVIWKNLSTGSFTGSGATGIPFVSTVCYQSAT